MVLDTASIIPFALLGAMCLIVLLWLSAAAAWPLITHTLLPMPPIQGYCRLLAIYWKLNGPVLVSWLGWIVVLTAAPIFRISSSNQVFSNRVMSATFGVGALLLFVRLWKIETLKAAFLPTVDAKRRRTEVLSLYVTSMFWILLGFGVIIPVYKKVGWYSESILALWFILLSILAWHFLFFAIRSKSWLAPFFVGFFIVLAVIPFAPQTGAVMLRVIKAGGGIPFEARIMLKEGEIKNVTGCVVLWFGGQISYQSFESNLSRSELEQITCHMNRFTPVLDKNGNSVETTFHTVLRLNVVDVTRVGD